MEIAEAGEEQAFPVRAHGIYTYIRFSLEDQIKNNWEIG